MRAFNIENPQIFEGSQFALQSSEHLPQVVGCTQFAERVGVDTDGAGRP
jgi:hypothetical protein